MRTVRVRRTLLAFGLALACVGCDVSVGDGGFNVALASGKATDEWTRQYQVAAGGKIEVRNINGAVTIEPADGERVEVRAERMARAGSDEAAKELLKRIEIQEDVKPDSVRIQTKAPSVWGREGHEVKYFVKVPASIRVEAHTTNGGIRMANLPNQLNVSSVNGGVEGERLSGHVDASTTNGGVQIRLDALSADGVELAAVNGGIELELPKASKADISARVVNGGIQADNLSLETTAQSRRHLEGRVNGGGSRVELSTTNGGVRIAGK
jgi:hypothetical protein